MSAVAELETGLNAMLHLKAPGVSGSRISTITHLCLQNIESESVLIQKLFTHFKKAPSTHKLGVLYVVDSVTRKWLDQAKIQGQPINGTAKDGTYAAGVHRVTELMPTLMNDIISTAPSEQQEKIKKLVDIWEKGQTLPPAMISSFREKLNNQSTTPPGSPPADVLGGSRSGPAPPSAMPNIMEALANIARQNTSASHSNGSAPAPAPAPTPSFAPVPSCNGALPLVPTQTTPSVSMPFLPPSQPAQPTSQTPVPSVGAPGLPFGFLPPAQQPPPQMPPALGAGAPNVLGALSALNALTGGSNPAAGFTNNPPAAPASAPAPAPGVDPKVQQQLALITTLATQGVPVDKIQMILSQLMGNNNGAPPALQPQLPQPTQSGDATGPLGGLPGPTNSWEAPRHDGSRDLTGYHDSMRSPNRMRGRSRSRSPRRWDGRGSPRGRDRGFEYAQESPGRGRPRGSELYRQRSPPGRRGQSPPVREPSQNEKWVEFDPNLPSGCIKVYSRTLFVGGVTCSEAELREVFSQYGQVQTCIVNRDKRHAFVKMYYRKDAQRAKEAMEDGRGFEPQLRTRWGVGYGPRDCSDYQTGISIIPIHKLTDADRKWMLTAPFGGSGGREPETGMCVEEPDIEIGAGVSSKAISRRMQTDKGGNHGPRSSRRDDDVGPGNGGGGNGGGGSGGRFRRNRDNHRNGGDNRRDDRMDRGANEEPVVVGFPPGITMGPNGINFPPGFSFGS